MSIAIDITDFSKNFDATVVLENLDLQVKPGEFLAIVGKSGCGKSTLLRSIAGLEEASRGRVDLDGRGVTGPHEQVRVMFQDDRLLPWRTALDNVKLAAATPDVASAALASVGLSEKQDAWPSELSGGQRQRVSLARALASTPGAILFDEPLGALDAFTRVEMQTLIEQLWLEQQFTSVLVTHDVSEAVALADRVIVLADGGISFDLQIDLPRPRTRDQQFFEHEQKILHHIIH